MTGCSFSNFLVMFSRSTFLELEFILVRLCSLPEFLLYPLTLTILDGSALGLYYIL